MCIISIIKEELINAFTVHFFLNCTQHTYQCITKAIRLIECDRMIIDNFQVIDCPLVCSKSHHYRSDKRMDNNSVISVGGENIDHIARDLYGYYYYGNCQGHVSLTIFAAIQTRWKIRLAVIPLLAIRSQQFFAHATTAQLLCHAQNFIAIIVWKSRR